MDIFDRIRITPGPLGQFAKYAEGYFVFPELEGELGPEMMFQGKKMITWSINDYLGLANHPEIRKVDAEAAKEYGLAYPMGARAMSGQTKHHAELEEKFAKFVGKEASYLLNFGYQGMVSTIDALVTKNDVIVYDVDSHACIIDGVRLHMGKRFTYKHNDIESFEKNLKRAQRMTQETGGGILVISEGVFGMRGEQGKLKEILSFKDEYKFRILVDDAHGFGTLGKTGAGAGEEQGVQDQIDVYFATFAKSLAGIGAFIAGDADIINTLKYNLRSQIFAKSLPMPMVLGGLKRLEMLQTNPELKQKLWENVRSLQAQLQEHGHNIGNTNTCVTPVFLQGTTIEATLMVKELREEHGIFTSVVVYPVIPKGNIILRLIPTARHTQEHIDKTVAALDVVKERLDNGVYARIEQEMNLQYDQH